MAKVFNYLKYLLIAACEITHYILAKQIKTSVVQGVPKALIH